MSVDRRSRSVPNNGVRARPVLARVAARGVAFCVILALVVAACSSTGKDVVQAPMTGEAAPDQGEGQAAAPAAGEGPEVAPLQPGGTGPGKRVPGQSLPDGGTTGGATTIPAGGGLGVTDTTITIGIHSFDSEAIYRAFGMEGPPSARHAGKAVIEYLNTHGGMAGRKIVPVYADMDSNGNWPASNQRNCTTFTEDNKVFVVASTVMQQGWQVLARCLANRKTVLVQTHLGHVADQREFDSYAPYLYRPNTVGGHRWGVAIDMLHDGGFFDKGAKIGLLYQDDEPSKRTVSGPIKQRLAHYGLKVSEEAAFSRVEQISDLGKIAQEGQSFVLRFRSNDISHVISISTQGAATFGFQRAAESQNYRPRWGTIADVCGPPGSAQCNRSLGVGWWWLAHNEEGDGQNFVPRSEQDRREWRRNPTYALCIKILRQGGLDPEDDIIGYTATCESLFFLKAVLDRVSAVTPAGFRSAVNKLGTAFRPVTTYSTRFGAGRYDGADQARLYVFDNDCQCLKYIGERRSVS